MMKLKLFVLCVLSILLCDCNRVNGEDSVDKDSSCAKYHFSCDGKCIEEVRKCDGVKDCNNGTDEVNCDFYCDDDHYLCLSGQCIGKELLCNGALDCHTDDDEDGCTVKECKKEEFKCVRSQNCLPSHWVCDGKSDCTDGSDEKNCTTSCPTGYSECKIDGACIPLSSICDGNFDCKDGGDEEICVGATNKVQCNHENGAYLCKDKKRCLKNIFVCDGTQQCEDGSDENGKCHLRCENMTRPCEHKCFRTPDGPKCECPKGFKIVDKTTCKDINECRGEKKVCDHFCENEVGSYSCSCAEKYMMLDDSATCRISGSAMLMFSVGNDIQTMLLDGSDSRLEYRGEFPTSGIAYDPKEKRIYWVMNDKKVYAKRIRELEDPELVIEHGLEKAENLACDWFGRNLYITDYKKNQILVCNIESVNCLVIVRKVSAPRALQLDLDERVMYWTATNSHTIERAGLDGSNRKIIVKENIVWANGLALDYPAKRIYWVDASLDQIDSADYDGKNRKSISNRDASHAYSLAVWQDKIYWTDWIHGNHKQIHSCRKRDAKDWSAIYKDSVRDVNNLAIYHSSMFEHTDNPCKSTYGKICSHLCLLSPSQHRGYVCKCPDNMKLDKSGHKCIENDSNMPLVALQSDLYIIRTRQFGRNFPQVQNYYLNLGVVADMDYNPAKNTLFFADTKNECIMAYNLSNKTVVKVIEKIKQPIAVAIDWLRDNLYWINGHHHTIEVVRTSGQFRRTIVYNTFNPTDIVLDVEEGYIFVSYGGSLSSIKKCELTGENCTAVADRDILKATSISIDLLETPKRVYWTDSEKNTIESVDVHGRNRKIDFHRLKHPMKIHLNGKNIFWTELRSSKLYVASKDIMEPTKIININNGNAPSGEWVMALTVFNITKSEVNTDTCFGAGRKCHHFCFTKTNQKVCSCSQGLSLSKDGSTCEYGACYNNQEKCDDGECIPSFAWCDGDKDCTDGSDEKNCTKNAQCNSKEYQCSDGTCIYKDFHCDGIDDCFDGSDEISCEKPTCKQMEWQCNSGECLPTQWRCNAIEDCEDKSDEINCETEVCKEGMKKCKYGRCIELNWWCDFHEDCPDGDDEENCPCKLGEYDCDGKCVDKAKICNGELTCKNHTNITCGPEDLLENDICQTNYVPCNVSDPKECIAYEKWCNGIVDCPGKDDEQDCQRCLENEVKCNNEDTCIDKRWICDDEKDCLDGSDEEGCSPKTMILEGTCTDREFECPDGSCILKHKLCDGFIDCINGVDEYGDCESCELNNGGCQHTCEKNPNKVICSCNEGFELSYDGRSCHDVNECKNEDLCHHVCTNRKGSYVCSCKEGFSLMSDEHTCRPKHLEHWPIALIADNRLNYLTEDLDLVERSKLSGKFSSSALHFMHDPKEEKFIGVNGDTGVIYKDSTKIAKLYSKETILASTLDYVNRNVYISQANIIYREKVSENTTVLESKIINSVVKIYNLDKNLFGELFTARDRKISAMEISLMHRDLFTCENYDEKGSLYSRNLDGSNERVIAEDKVKRCDSLALDDYKKRVYWADTVLNKIESVDYLGGGRQRFISEKIHGPTDLTLVGHSLIWFNNRHQTLVKCSIRNPNNCIEKYKRNVHIISLKYSYNVSVESPCHNSFCPHMCVPHALDVPHCVCSDGFEKVEDFCVEETIFSNLISKNCDDDSCNVGECKTIYDGHSVCRCPDNYKGKFCEIYEETAKSEDSKGKNLVIIILILLTFLALICVLAFIYREKLVALWKKRPQSRLRYVASSLVLLNEEETGSQPPTPILPRNSISSNLQRETSKDSNDSAIVIEPLEPHLLNKY